MMAQSDLATAWRNGDHGRASNVHIVKGDGYSALVGYGWAVYGVILEDGTEVYFKGWYGYSPSTSSQLSKMVMEANADVVCNKAPSITGTSGRRGYGRSRPRDSLMSAIEHVREEHL